MSGVVIVGASLGGVRAAESLRAQGFSDRICMIGDENVAPYDRPPLSKQVLVGSWPMERVTLRPFSEYLDQLNVDLRLGVRAEALDLDTKVISTSTGDEVPFDGLVIATGTRVRRLAGTDAVPTVHVLRTLDDAVRLRHALVGDGDGADGRRVVVIGAGFIGAEAAASARALGADVVVLETLPVPLERQLGADMARAVTAIHARHGVVLHTGVSVATVDHDGVTLADGRHFPADVIVVGIGVVPNTEWLEGSGLAVADGVVCDATCRAAPNVVAVGDVARWPHALYDAEATIRVEHWTNAAEMAAHAVTTLLADMAGTPESATAFAPVPYFWSDQYDAKIQFLGRATGFDEVRIVDGSTEDGKWVALYRSGDHLVAALGVTRMRLLAGYRRLLAEQARWTDALAHAGAS